MVLQERRSLDRGHQFLSMGNRRVLYRNAQLLRWLSSNIDVKLAVPQGGAGYSQVHSEALALVIALKLWLPKTSQILHIAVSPEGLGEMDEFLANLVHSSSQLRKLSELTDFCSRIQIHIRDRNPKSSRISSAATLRSRDKIAFDFEKKRGCWPRSRFSSGPRSPFFLAAIKKVASCQIA